MIKLERLTSTVLLPASAIFVGYLLVNSRNIFDFMIALAGFLVASLSLSVANAFLLLLLSVSIVLPLLQLPFSELTYLRLDDFVWIIALIAVIRKRYVSRMFNLLEIFPNLKPLIFFCFLAAFSLFRIAYLFETNTKPIMHSLWFQLKFLQCVLVLAMTMFYFPIKKRELLLKAVVFMGSFLAIIGILQYLNVLPPYEYHQTNKFSPGQVASILSANSTHLGIYMVTALFLGYGTFELSQNARNKIMVVIAIALMFVCLILTGSRSSWIGFVVGNMVFFWASAMMRRRTALLTIVIGVTVIITAIMPDIKEILLSSVTNEHRIGSAVYRFNAYARFIEVLKSDPLIGVIGVGFMNWRYTLVQSTEITWAHNNYLSVLGELGLPGLILFLWFWFSTFNIVRNLAKCGDIWAKSYMAIVSAYLVASLTAEVLYPVWAFENLLLFIMLVLGVVLSSNRCFMRGGKQRIG